MFCENHAPTYAGSLPQILWMSSTLHSSVQYVAKNTSGFRIWKHMGADLQFTLLFGWLELPVPLRICSSLSSCCLNVKVDQIG